MTTRSPGASPRRCTSTGRELAFTYQGDALLEARQAARRADQVRHHPALRRRGHRLGRQGVRNAQGQVGHHGLPRSRRRLLGQERTEGPLCRHHARELRSHHGDLLLLLHRKRQARGGADAQWRLDGHADLQWRRSRHAELQRDGRGQGGAGSLGALSRRRFRSRRRSASTPSRPGRSARSPAPASAMRATCSPSSRNIRRSAAA